MNTFSGKFLSISGSNVYPRIAPDSTSRFTLKYISGMSGDKSSGLFTFYNEYTGRYITYTTSNSLVATSSTSSNYTRNFKLVRDTYWVNTRATYSIETSTRNITHPSMVDTSSVTLGDIRGGTVNQWSLVKVDKGTSRIYSFGVTGFDSRGANNDFVSYCNNLGYAPVVNINDHAQHAYYVLNKATSIYNLNIWVFNGRGVPNLSAVPFLDSSNNITSLLSASNDLSQYNLDSLDNSLATVQCMLYMADGTGASYNNKNLVDSSISAGAHFALGTLRNTTIKENNDFIIGFFKQASDYYNVSIEDCLIAGFASSTYTEESVYYMGDRFQHLS